MPHKTDSELIANTRNIARFFAEHRQISLVALAAVFVWGWYGYAHMPKRKDPDIPVRIAVAICPWPGVNSQQVEQLITRPIEEIIAQNKNIHPATAADFGIRSTSLRGLSIVTVQLAENIRDTKTQFSDINLKLRDLNSRIPQGAGPIRFLSDFGDTATLMLTIASPPADDVDVALRAREIKFAIQAVRPKTQGSDRRLALVYFFPTAESANSVRRNFVRFTNAAESDKVIRDVRPFEGIGHFGFDAASDYTEDKLLAYAYNYIRQRLNPADLHPDAWQPAVIRNPDDAEAKLRSAAGEKYSYRQLDEFTDLISRTLLGIPQASKAERAGVLPQAIYLDYSQDRLASYGFQPRNLATLLNARNISLPGGQLDLGQKNLMIDPSGQFDSVKAIGSVITGRSSSGSPVYLRDLVDISRGYQSPASYLNYYTWRDSSGHWRRSRAVTLALFMKSGEQVQEFGREIDQKLDDLRKILPRDVIIARTSDQPRQVEEKLDVFMEALYEAIALVILVSLIGFWEWRSALLMALAIPITLAMNFGVIYLLGIDLQQVSIAALIIALGLLVDDPVVAGDAIKNDMARGNPRLIAAWLGPSKLAKAIMYATVTNIIAYLPFLLLTGNTGYFLYSLPIVMTSALACSRIVSMTFIPMLGYYLLRPGRNLQPSTEQKRQHGFTGLYYRLSGSAIRHRWLVFLGSLTFLAGGVLVGTQLKSSFFPDDVQYWSYLDIWLPNDASFSATNHATQLAEQVVERVSDEYGRTHPGKDGQPRQILRSITSFVGGGSPRFWATLDPQQRQLNYAQAIIQVTDKNDTPALVNEFQEALSREVPGARIDARQLQTNPVSKPIQVLLSGQLDVTAADEPRDIRTLRELANHLENILRSSPYMTRVRTDWDVESFGVKLEIDPDRANLAGVTNLDVATSSTASISGQTVTTFREGDQQIPVISRLRMEERSRLSDIQDLYVYSSADPGLSVPLLAISSIKHTLETQRINRQEHFRTVSVEGFPSPGRLNSEALNPVIPALRTFQRTLPTGYRLQISGERAKQEEGFANLAVVNLVMIFGIYLALLLQFDNAVKPALVFAAAPYGAVGALVSLYIMNSPFGFMAALAIISLVGVIISHVIVLFDFIEEMHERGEPLEVALRDAGIQRLRPVLITVGATILALIPLALHGGPLWEPLCYAQIGGLAVATFITLLLVPVLYSIFVLDLKIVKW
jgi:multidrug efflux pump